MIAASPRLHLKFLIMAKRKSRHTKAGAETLNYRTLWRLFRTFAVHYKNNWKLLTLVYISLLFSVLFSVISPWPLKLIIDHVILNIRLPERAAWLDNWFGTNRIELLVFLVVAYFVIQLLNSLISFVHSIGILMAGERIVAAIRAQLFGHMQRLSLSFHGQAQSGDMVYRLTSDVRDIMGLLIRVPENIVFRLTVILVFSSIMFAIHWRLALVALSMIPLMLYFNRRFGKGVQRATRKKRAQESEVSMVISETVSAMALVQAYGREEHQQTRFENENQLSLASGITAMQLSKIFKRLNDVLVALGTFGVVYYGGILVLDGRLFPGTLVLFMSYLKSLYGPIDKFVEMLLDIAGSQVSGERILEIIENDQVVKESPHAVAAPPFHGRVEFRDVDFSYHNRGPALEDVGFTALPGETIALVGHSGAGKTTLVRLLMRFYDPQRGQVLIDEQDVRDFKLKSLRDQVTILMQEAKLFNQTVSENIAFGKEGATEEEVLRAAQLAQAHDFIAQLPEGYDTMIYEGGENFSGGQQQRINIARALIRNTPLIILDEPATALDAATEAKIHEALHALTRGKTTFIIAHKFATIARADKILVLKEGRLVGFGKHEDLLVTCDEYRELYELQFGANTVYAEN